MKKVLLNAYACSPIRGSEPGCGWNWAINLAKKGYEVWCLTNVEDKREINEEHSKLNLPNLKFIFIVLPFGLDEYLLDTSSKKIYFHYFIWMRKAFKIAQQIHSKEEFDIAHHVTFASFQQGTYLWKLKDVKIIFGPVGGGQKALPEFKSYFGTSWLTEIIRNLISDYSFKVNQNLRNTIAKADVVLTTNDETRNLLINSRFYKPGTNHFILDSAVPILMEELEYIEKNNDKILELLWVGRMLPRKGLNLILHALSFLPDNIDYVLTIVGGGEQLSLVDGWIHNYKLNRARIRILGQIPFSEVTKWYRNSDVFIFCSLRDSFGSQILEAMAFSLPVIVLDISGVSLGVPDNCGIKVKPTTKDATAIEISNAIVKLYQDIDFRCSCSLNAYNYAMSSTWAKKIDLVTSKFY